MKRCDLIKNIFQKKSVLCVGLDTDINQLPKGFSKRPEDVLRFNQTIIDATKDFAVAYKINTAFYESLGHKGWKIMEETLNYIPSGIFTIADAKRGDIGNTSRKYAEAFFHQLSFDAITVNPYMGKDSITPFLEFDNKWIIILGLTSNAGAEDFQLLPTQLGNKKVYEIVMEKTSAWGTSENTMFVVGATRPTFIREIRNKFPQHFFLIPGIGKQGGDLSSTIEAASNHDMTFLINASRSIIFASQDEDFAECAANEAKKMQNVMSNYFS
jgi:orotidine-5'-phosphate decarboxylase